MKKSIKQLLSAVLVIAMMASLLVVPAAAADKAGDIGDKWVFTEGYTSGTSYEGATLSSGISLNGPRYGIVVSNGGTVQIPVKQSCDIKIGANYSWNLSIDGNASNAQSGSKDLPEGQWTELTFHYTKGSEDTVTITAHGTSYICWIELVEASTEPEVTVDKEEVVATEGDTVTLNVGILNAGGKEASWVYDVAADTAITDVASAEDGKVSFTADKAGKATLTLKATVDGEEYTKDVVVYVKPATIGEVVDGYTLDFTTNGGNDDKLAFYTADKASFNITGGFNGQHGMIVKKNDSLTLKIPADKKANVTLLGCSYGKNEWSYGESSTAVKSGSGDATQHDATGVTGTVTFTNKTDGEMYLHGIKVELVDLSTPSLILDPASVDVKVGETADVAIKAENYDGKTPFAISEDEETATVTVAADGKTLTVEGVKAGGTTVYVVMGTAAPADVAAAKADASVKAVAVTVTPAGAREVGNETIDFTGDDGETTWKTTDAAVIDARGYNGPQHGLDFTTDNTITLKLPEGKAANVTILGCQYGNVAFEVTDSTGESFTLSQSDNIIPPANPDDENAQPENARNFTAKGVTGTVVIKATGQTYVHGVKIELVDANAPSLTVSPASVTMRAGASRDVTVDAKNYGETFKPFAIPADATVATAAVAADGKKVTVTGAKEGTTKVYIGMAETAPADATAAAAVEGVEEVAVTVEAALAEGVKEWVWGGSDGSHSKATFEADSVGLKFAEGNKVEAEDGTVDYVTVKYWNNYGLWAHPKLAEDKTTIEVPATIGIPVEGPSKITVVVGYTWDIALGDAQSPDRYGSESAIEGNNGSEQAKVFNYYGGAGYVTLTANTNDKGAPTYIYSIKVEPDATIPAVPKVAVWDLQGTKLDETMFDNRLTVEDIIAFYQPSEQWPDSKVPTLGSFATKDGVFAFVAEASDNESMSYNGVRNDYRLRTGSEALKDWVHSTNNHTKNDVALGADPYDPTLTQYGVSFQSNGGVMTFKIKADAGDKLTFTYANSGTADGAIFMDYIDAADAATEGKITKTVENQKGVGNGNIASVYVAQSGIQTITHGLDPDGNVQKPAVSRFYLEKPIKATISGNLTVGAGVPNGYKLIATDDVSGVEYEGTVTGGKYSIEVNNYLSGTSFTLSVANAEGCIVGSGAEVEIPAAATSADNDVAIIQVDMVTISGKVTGLETADLANLVIDVAIPEGKIYVPKIIPAEDGTYTASLEKGVEYTLTAKNVNDYTQGFTTLNKTADETGVDLAFTAKPRYMVTLIAIPTDVDMSAAKFTFTNANEVDDLHPDGYVYTFTGADIVELRDGQYKIKMDNAPYPAKVISDLKVSGAATSKTINFVKETPTSWVFTQDTFTADVLAAKDFNMLKLDGDVRREAKDHAILGNGGKLSVPVSGPCKVNVTVYYAASGTVGVGSDTVELKTDVSTGSTSSTDTITYEYTGAGEGYVDIIGGDKTSYITRIDVVTATPYVATLTVGADKEFDTIQAAVDAATRMERPNNERVTIMIDPGNYEEMIWVQTPNITFKNAAANPSIALKNKGLDIDDNAVRITWYYGCGFDYYSMGLNSKFSAEQLAVNLENGYVSHPNSSGGGSNNECWWNATTVIAATGFQAEDIIFENSFNQYVSEAAGRDKIVPNGGAKEDRSKPRADLPVGSTEVQRKVYVERAAAIALANDKADNAFFDHCAFVGHQDVIYGGRAVRAGFYDCDVFGACDYIFGPMTAVFAKCDMVLNVGADSDTNDAAYITAPQNGSGVHGYLMYNCNVRSVEPGVENAGTAVTALQHEWGRAWGGATAECVFFETTVGTNANGKSLISPAGWNTGLGSSQICAEYHTHDEAADADYSQRIMGGVLTEAKTKAGDSLTDWAGWMKGWDPFVGKSMIIEGCPDKNIDASALNAALTAANKAVNAYTAMADGTTAADVAKGEKFVTESAKAALEAAIAEAAKVASKPEPTQEEIDAAVPALTQAVADFNAAVQTGTKAVDMAALDAAIASAKTTAGAYAAKPDATVASDVEMGEQYVTETAKAALEKAIADAEAAKAKTDATQAEVNAAVWALNKAVTAYKNDIQTGTKLADRTALLAALDAAQKAVNGVVVMDEGTKPEDVALGVKFVTKADKDALDAAIAAAKAVVAKGNASQAEVDAAVAPLNAAKAAFDAVIQIGTNDTGIADRAALEAAIAAAEGVYAIGNDVEVLPAGTKTSDVTSGKKFVTQDVYDALAAAIDAAKAVLADPNATEEDIAKAVADLKAAQDAFKVQTGTKGTGGGSSVSGGSAGSGTTTTTKTNANGDTVKKTTDRDGNVTYTVTSKDGELLATVKLPATVSALDKKFKDVPDNHWAANSINDLAALGMVKGVADEIYDMISPVTRGSLATILFRLAQGKEGYTNNFSDVVANTWYTDAVGWAAKTGVVNGFEDGTFRPDDSITREQLVVMLYRFAKLLALDTSAEGSLAGFTDGATTSDWAKEAMVWAVGAGIVKGDDVKALHPTAAATRAETACMVDRFLGLLK